MAIKICPLLEGAYYVYSIDLSNETYSLTFRWNERLQQWMMDIDDSEDNKIIQGVSIVPAFPLLKQYALEKPIGDFYLLPVELSSPDIPNPREIFKTHYLVYDDFTS